jgi:MFS family permease
MDLAFEAAGDFGKFQKIVAYLVLSVASMCSISSIAFPFLTMQPNFLCKDKTNFYDEFRNCHHEDLCKDSIFEYKKLSETSLNNISYEFDLYCDNEPLIGMIGSAFFVGGIFGSIFLSRIPDLYGREKIYKILIIINFIIQLNFLFAFSPQHFILMNFLAGFNSYCMSMCTLILTEYLPRATAGLIMSLHSSMDPISGILFALFFLYINNWRLLMLISSIYSFIMVVVALKFFQESPRWLNSKNLLKESLEALEKIAIINGNQKNFQLFLTSNSNLIGDNLSKIQEDKKTYNLFEIFGLNSQKFNIQCLSYIWFAIGFCYFGLLLNIEHLGGNMFVNSIITYLADIISELITGYLSDEFGRIIVMKICGVLGGTSFILYETLHSVDHWIKSVLIFVTSFGFSGIYNLVYIYSPEVFPTSIRSTVMGWLYFSSRIGACLVPIFMPLIPHNPYLLGLMQILTAYVASLMLETLGKDIPDDVPENLNQKSVLSRKHSNASPRKGIRKVSSLFSLGNYSGRRTIISDSYFRIQDF